MYFKRSITFRLNSRKNKAGEQKVMIRASWCGERIELHTPHHISAKQWDARKQRAKGKENASGVAVHLINSDLDTLQSYMQEAFNRYEFVEGHPPTKDELRELYNDLAGRQTDTPQLTAKAFATISEVCEVYLQETSRGREPDTHKKYITLCNHLCSWNGGLEIDDFNTSAMQEFESYLYHQVRLRAITLQRMMTRAKGFLRWASSNGYYRGDVHNTYKVSVKGANTKEVIVLSPEELKQLIDCEIPRSKAYLDRVRDLLLFGCFTGLRFSDIQQLTPAHIVNNTIRVITRKTSDPINIELNKHSQAIIDKYKGVCGDRLLPRISNQKCNNYLKELGELAGLDTPTVVTYYDGAGRHTEIKPKYELLSTHIGRRTFITNALQLGISLPTIMSWTGHKDVKAMRPYIKLVESHKRKEIAKFDTLLK